VAQTPPPSEGAKVLIDDAIQALKSNDTNKAQIHLNILKQQLPTFVDSTSLESLKVLLDDASSALKNNDVNKAIVHLVKQQFANPANNVTSGSEINNLSTYKNSTYGITSIQYPSDWTVNETNILLILLLHLILSYYLLLHQRKRRLK
jgi:predicted rRNA methylase YqxC with S4 and FtsJ domains